MKLYGFWRSLATIRVRVALNLKGVAADEQVSVNLLKGEQHDAQFRKVNPQGAVPALVLDDGKPALFQSLAIIEYLDETHPEPPLLPPDPRGRARVRGLSLIAAADGHPLIVPRVRHYLEHELKIGEDDRNKWLAHWTGEALKAMEGHLAGSPDTGRYSHGDSVTMADLCLASQVIGAQFFKADTAGVPTVMRIFAECMKLPAFEYAHPLKQPDAPQASSH
jgi:maleylacetoacetate isomerase/maleylpyruvate isomerase